MTGEEGQRNPAMELVIVAQLSDDDDDDDDASSTVCSPDDDRSNLPSAWSPPVYFTIDKKSRHPPPRSFAMI
jgi:hypothetical protein